MFSLDNFNFNEWHLPFSQQFWLFLSASLLTVVCACCGTYIYVALFFNKRALLMAEKSTGFKQVISFSHTWSIANVTALFADSIASRRPVIHSASFGPTDNDPVQFSLELYLRGFSSDYEDQVSVYLNLDTADKDEIEAIFKISIIDANRKKVNSQGDYSVSRFCTDNLGWGVNDFIRRVDLLEPSNGYLANSALTIHCEVYMVSTSGASFTESGSEPSMDFSDLLENEKFSDVSLIVGTQQLPAHKVILATRSPVFSDMFRFAMKESVENQVDITETKLELFRQLLTYIYTGKVPSIDRSAAELLPLADKFQVDTLKTVCEQHLTSQLSINSVLDMLRYAERHSADLLRDEALNFIRKQISYRIQATSDSAQLEQVFGDLVLQNEVLAV